MARGKDMDASLAYLGDMHETYRANYDRLRAEMFAELARRNAEENGAFQAEIVRLRREGRGLSLLSNMSGMGRQTLANWTKEAGL